MSYLVYLIQNRGPFLVAEGEIFIENKLTRLSIEKRSLCNLSDVSLAQQFMELSTFICLTCHLSDKIKIRCKFSLMTHKLNVLVSFVRHSSCPDGPSNKIMWFKLISPGFFRKDFITEDLLDIHEKPFKKDKKKWKRLFLYYWDL